MPAIPPSGKKKTGKMAAILFKEDVTQQLPAERTSTLTIWTTRQTHSRHTKIHLYLYNPTTSS